MRRVLKSKRVWIPLLCVAAAVPAAWAALPEEDLTLDELEFTEGRPSAESRRDAPWYGTRVRFEASPGEAFAAAHAAGKLVLLLHLSGEFGSSEMT